MSPDSKAKEELTQKVIELTKVDVVSRSRVWQPICAMVIPTK